jgi:hypothetical protein
MDALATVFALAIATTPPAAGTTRCHLSSPLACRDTNELVWDKAFDNAVERFLGSRRANYFGRPARVADQVLEVLGGPPDEAADQDRRPRPVHGLSAAVLRRKGRGGAAAGWPARRLGDFAFSFLHRPRPGERLLSARDADDLHEDAGGTGGGGQPLELGQTGDWSGACQPRLAGGALGCGERRASCELSVGCPSGPDREG